MDSRKNYLKKELVRITEELDLINQHEIEEKRRNFRPGYFKYLNSYGGETEKWYLYVHTWEMNSEGMLLSHEFQKCSDGKIYFSSEEYFESHLNMKDYLPISEEEFEIERQVLLKELQEFR